MTYRTVEDAKVDGAKVLVRVDFNVPLDGDEITDDTRIRAALPTIQHLIDRNASLVLMSHLGRPKGKPNPEFSLRPVAGRLAALLGRPVALADDVVGESAERLAAALQPGEVLLLENVRFEPGEEKNDPGLAKRLARLGDLYVNDAFGAAHRAHASTAAIAGELPSFGGFLMREETAALDRLTANADKPFVAILGGAKVSDKLAVIGNLLPLVDAVLIGGGMANTILLAQGVEIGTSLAEPDLVEEARSILTDAETRGVAVLLPVDVVIAPSIDATSGETVALDAIPADQSVFDIGPGTIERYRARIGDAKTIFWNGPMGVFEREPFAAGTLAVARAVAASDAYSVIGGGDSVAAVTDAGVADLISHISTGGGASLEYIEGKTLPGIAALVASAERSGT